MLNTRTHPRKLEGNYLQTLPRTEVTGSFQVPPGQDPVITDHGSSFTLIDELSGVKYKMNMNKASTTSVIGTLTLSSLRSRPQVIPEAWEKYLRNRSINCLAF
jgi:hypothetical protein|tara:strand:+ start:11282 stop:11590 length:309 start_codon:yes stop_codon:yes gene_type:complete